jgi:hypothetical protein
MSKLSFVTVQEGNFHQSSLLGKGLVSGTPKGRAWYEIGEKRRWYAERERSPDLGDRKKVRLEV